MVKNILKKISQTNSGNSSLIIILFIFSIVFQLTGLKFIWGIEPFSRGLNLMLLVLLFIFLFFSLKKKYSQTIWYYYLIPGMMILFGETLNIIISCFSDISNANLLGTTFPWVLFLIIPYFINQNKIKVELIWKWYYYFMVIFMLLGFYDYFIFAQLSNLKALSIPFGTYLGGRFSWLYMNEDGTPHLRFYACFYEPGTLAMFLLPAIAYAFFKKHFLGLIPLLIAFYLTLSLGGVFSLILLAIVITFKSIAKSKKTFIYSFLIIGIMASIIYTYTATTFKDEYNEKGESATAREEGVSKMFENLPSMFFNYPLGIPYSSKTSELEKVSGFTGTNFLLGTYLQFGGIIALVGIMIILFVSMRVSASVLLNINSTIDEKIVYSSLIVLFPFIFQRTTIWDSALFGLMFSPYIIKAISDADKVKQLAKRYSIDNTNFLEDNSFKVV